MTKTRHECNELQNIRRNRMKLEVLRHYGRVCACCGEPHIALLTVDHTAGDGKEHRKSLPGCGTGAKLYKWLIDQGFPMHLGLEIVCFNCNWGRRYNGGVCPHQDPTYVDRRYNLTESEKEEFNPRLS